MAVFAILPSSGKALPPQSPLADVRCSWTALARRNDHTIVSLLCWLKTGKELLQKGRGKRDPPPLSPLADDRCSWTALARRDDHAIHQNLCLLWWQKREWELLEKEGCPVRSFRCHNIYWHDKWKTVGMRTIFHKANI
ncbi:hypothetical protein CEXT_290051 [Caerostris extrusa]|uniref:Uncharacterized protein n=1 Tax=Caerostris extrusa TaxID=172846 RepID=A0AAV4NEP1_CAEEX|nr:hypothetical protein CEXT_290051 [Caerostris extrusa]